jgi:hypothetical protein
VFYSYDDLWMMLEKGRKLNWDELVYFVTSAKLIIE